jgi:type III secretory pathway component EscR
MNPETLTIILASISIIAVGFVIYHLIQKEKSDTASHQILLKELENLKTFIDKGHTDLREQIQDFSTQEMEHYQNVLTSNESLALRQEETKKIIKDGAERADRKTEELRSDIVKLATTLEEATSL